MAAVEVLPRAVRIGREKPLGAATPKPLRAIGQLLERTQLFAATPWSCPSDGPVGAHEPAAGARGEQGQLRLRTGYGGMDRVMVTGATGNDNPYCGALLAWRRQGQGKCTCSTPATASWRRTISSGSTAASW